MAITPKSVTLGTNTGSTATVSVTTSESPSATASGDLVIVFHANDFYLLSNMATPTATGSPTLNAITGTGLPADGGANHGHIKGYWYVANTGGAQTIFTTETGAHDEEKALLVCVLSGADVATAIDAAAGGSGTTSTSNIAPSVSPATSDAYLLSLVVSGGGASASSYGTPAPLTEDGEIHVGGFSGVYAHQQLSASGATGTFTFTPEPGGSAVEYASITVAVKTAAGGGGATVDGWQQLCPGFMVGPAFPPFMRAFSAPFSSDPASSGTNWPVSQTDDAGVTDSVVIDQLKVTTDPEGLTDTTVIDQTKVITDPAALTDSTVVDQFKVLTDNAVPTDSTVVENGKLVTQTDVENLTDAITVDQAKTFTDLEGLTDTQAVDQTKVATDAENLTDSTLIENGKLVTQTDLEGLTDSVVFSIGDVKADDAGITDTAALSQAKVVTDAENLTDSTLVENGKSVAQTDTAGMTDAISIVLNAVKVDTATLADSVAVTFSKVLADLLGLTDSTTVQLTGATTADTNPITLTIRETGNRTTISGTRRQTVATEAATTVREPRSRLTLRPSTQTTVQENS